jgi:hypothetical protein
MAEIPESLVTDITSLATRAGLALDGIEAWLGTIDTIETMVSTALAEAVDARLEEYGFNLPEIVVGATEVEPNTYIEGEQQVEPIPLFVPVDQEGAFSPDTLTTEGISPLDQLAQLQTDIDTVLSEELPTLTKDVRIIEGRLTKETSTVNTKVLTLEDKLDSANEKVSHLKSKVSSLEAQVDRLNRQPSNLDDPLNPSGNYNQ